MAMAQHGIRVGFALKEKRAASLLTSALIEEAEQRGLSLLRINDKEELQDQGPFHIIIHKLMAEDGWVSKLAQYSRLHPHVVIVDDVEAVRRLDNRLHMLEVAGRLNVSEFGITVDVPKQMLWDAGGEMKGRSGSRVDEEAGGGNIQEMVARTKHSTPFPTQGEGLRFPVVAKPVDASASVGAHAHDMALVLAPAALPLLTPPLILQEFINHGGFLFKLYVLGDMTMVFKRSSLPDVAPAPPSREVPAAVRVHAPTTTLSSPHMDEEVGLIRFDRISNVPMEKGEAAATTSVVDPPADVMHSIGQQLRALLGLQVFNVDILREGGSSSRLYIVDINFLPGYEKLPGFPSFFVDFLLSHSQRKSSAASPSSAPTEEAAEAATAAKEGTVGVPTILSNTAKEVQAAPTASAAAAQVQAQDLVAEDGSVPQQQPGLKERKLGGIMFAHSHTFSGGVFPSSPSLPYTLLPRKKSWMAASSGYGGQSSSGSSMRDSLIHTRSDK